jgi:dCMP deaminase
MLRPSWDEYFIGVMETVANRATCDRGKSGCIIVRNKRIISTGYVGSPSGLPHCDDAGHLFQNVLQEDGSTKQHCIRTIHAEMNAICQAAKHGVSLEGATLYSRMEPCYNCAYAIIAVGIARVVSQHRYQAAQRTRDMFQTVGIELVVLEDSLLYPV